MSKAKDRYYEFKVIADAHFGGLSDDVTGYVEELEAYQAYTGDLIRCYEDQRIKLEAENQTLKLEQKQCLLCTARHKEELSEVKQQKAELIEFLKDIHKTHALRYDKALEARILIESINGVKYEQSER